MARNSAFPRRSRQSPFLRQRRKIDGLARFWTVPTNFLQPKNFPIADTFVGRDGTALNPAKWYTVAGTALIASNTASFATDSGSGSEEYVGINPSLLSGQNGRWDIRVDMTIVDTTSVNAMVLNGVLGVGGYNFLVFTDGSTFQLSGPADGGAAGTTRALVANDILHHRIVRDSITGRLDWYYWVNNVAEPSTPEVTSFDTSQGATDEIWLGRVQQDGMVSRYDNFSVTTPNGAFPAPIALAATVPDPTASGTTPVNGTATPTAIARTVVTPAATITGNSNTTPAAITRTVVTPAPTTSGNSNTTPTAIALTAVTPAPTATGGTGGTATPTAIALTAVTSAPTATGGSNTTPAAIARTVVTPAPTITGNSNTTPAAIALAAAVYDYVGYPVVSTAASTAGNTASAIAVLTASGTVAGDLLLVMVGSTTLVAPAGYTKLFEQATGTSFTIWGRIATGTSDGFYSNTANQATYVMWRITHHNVVTLASDIKVSSGVTTSTNVFDPPSLDAGSNDQWLWIAAAYYATSSGGLFDNTPPTGYSGVLRGNSGGSGVVSNTEWAWKQATAQTENPSTMGASTASANVLSGVAVTLAVQPASHLVASGSSNTTPAAITRSAVTPAPTITGTANTTPAAIALTAVTSAPTASGNSNATPAAIALTVVLSAPTITGTASTTPTAITLSAVTSAPTTSGGARAPPTAIDLAAVTSAPTATGEGIAEPTAIDLLATAPDPDVTGGTEGVARPNPFPLGVRVSEGTTHTFTDDFTGADGDPLDPAKWESDGTGETIDIQSNRAHIEIASGGFADLFTVPLAPREFYDLYAEITIADIDGGDNGGNVGYLSVTASPDNVGGFYLEPGTGFISTGSGASTDTLTIVDGDTIKVRVIRGSSATETYVWISGPQPGTPMFTEGTGRYRPNHQPDFFFDSAASTPWVFDLDNFSFTYWDALVVVTGDANVFPTAIALTATTPAPTATGGTAGVDGAATPTTIALTVTTSAPTASGSSTTTPAAITLTATTSTPTASGQGVALPTTIALSATTPAPTASGSGAGQATPPAIALTTTVTTPTASGQGVASPATIARAVVLSAPTATGGADGTASPAAITVAATVTTPTGTGTANTSPAAIARAAVTPAPQVTGASAGQASPAAVMLSAVLGTATVSGGGTATPPTTDLAAATDAPNATGTVVYFPYWGARVG